MMQMHMIRFGLLWLMSNVTFNWISYSKMTSANYINTTMTLVQFDYCWKYCLLSQMWIEFLWDCQMEKCISQNLHPLLSGLIYSKLYHLNLQSGVLRTVVILWCHHLLVTTRRPSSFSYEIIRDDKFRNTEFSSKCLCRNNFIFQQERGFELKKSLAELAIAANKMALKKRTQQTDDDRY